MIRSGPAGADVPWAQACDTRRALERHWMEDWPEESMNRSELRQLALMRSSLDEALSRVRALQSSLSGRSKALGRERPDFAEARARRARG